MTNQSRRKAQYTREKNKLYKLIGELFFNDEFNSDDPVYQRAVEIGRKKHLPLTEAMKLAEQELSNA